jgi:DNA polymerase-3 subunit epsilon
MSRACVVDVETTGLDPDAGHRIIEIAAVEILDGRPTGAFVKQRVNPEGFPIQWASYVVHGIKNEELTGEPIFSEAWPRIAAFIGDSRMIAHNAPFDMRFISAECRRAGFEDITEVLPVEDSIGLAKRLWPGKPVSLDAICKRLDIGLDARSGRHNALVDSNLLADAYCRMRALIEQPRTQANFFDVLERPDTDGDETPIPVPSVRPPDRFAA